MSKFVTPKPFFFEQCKFIIFTLLWLFLGTGATKMKFHSLKLILKDKLLESTIMDIERCSL